MIPSASTPIRLAAGALMAIALGAPAWAAGSVQVTFTQPENYTDIGFPTMDREYNLKALSLHMSSWADRLPDGLRLEIEVLDVDLAGEVRAWMRMPEARVLRGRVDWPRMSLRWQLKSADQVLRAGEERLSDMGYLSTSARLQFPQALAYDIRMLDDWLNRQILPLTAKR